MPPLVRCRRVLRWTVVFAVGAAIACREAPPRRGGGRTLQRRHLLAERYQAPGDPSAARVPTATVGGVIRPVLDDIASIPLFEKVLPLPGGADSLHIDVPLAHAPPLCLSFSVTAAGVLQYELPPRLVAPSDADEPFDLPIAPLGSYRSATIAVHGRALREQPYVTPAITIPRGARLRFDVGVFDFVGASPETAKFTLTAIAEESQTVLLSEQIDAQAPDRAAWRAREVDLGAFAERTIRLRFESALAGCGSVPLWADPTILAPRPATAASARKRNLLLISIDTLRPDRLGCYGYQLPTSPVIDRTIAAGGTLFEHAYASYPSTTASHMTLFTSLDPCVHHVVQPSMAPLRADAHLLAEYLRAAEYETAAFTEDTYLLAQNGFVRGFGTYMESTDTRTVGVVEETLDHARRWIEAHRDDPWFVFVHTYQVHAPYTPPPGYRARIGAPDDASGNYDAEIRYTDTVLGGFLDALDTLEPREDVLLVFLSDHGEQFGEHGLTEHGNSLYDVLLHVPLILRAPGLVPAGQRIAASVGLVDLVPTLLDLLELPPPSPAQGRSVAPLIRGEPMPPATLYAGPLRSQVAARVEASHSKWIIDRASGGRTETYAPDADPGEAVDVGGPTEVRDQIIADYGRHCAVLPPVPPGSAERPSAIPSGVREKLRALGYLP